MSDRNAAVIDEFRANGGRVGGFFEGKPLLLLHNTGAKSGIRRVTPLIYLEVPQGYAIFGSKGGAPSHPAWFHNVVANPDVTVEVGTETIDMVARVVAGSEREKIWEEQKSRFPFFGDYEVKASDREIPVIVLESRREAPGTLLV